MLVRKRRHRTERLRSPVAHSCGNLLEIRHLAKRFGAHQAVVDVSFALHPGEVLGLLGPNGAGKSTTMLMICGLLNADAGEVLINGRSFDGRNRELKRMLGLVPQDLAIYPELNAIENLQFFGRLYGLNGSELKSRCEEVLHQIGLAESAHRPSGTYSGGMKRRLNFGIALVHQPQILGETSMSAWQITRKDLSLLLKDKRAVVLLLVLPLLFISIVGMSTGQFLTRDDDSQRFRILIVDKNGCDLSRQLVQTLQNHREFLVTVVPSSVDANASLQRGDASMLLTIGPLFESRAEELRISDVFNSDSGPLAGGPEALDLKLETRPAAIGVGRLLEGVLFTQVIKVVAPLAARKNPITRTWLNDASVEPTTDEQPVMASTAEKKIPRTTAVYSWIVPGFTVMFAFFVISVMARSFIAERDNGTLRRLLMAPVSRVSVLAGKTIPFYLTSVVQCLLLFLCGRLLFGMSWGPDPIYLVPVILCTSLAATSLGLLLATAVQTDQQVSSYGTTLILVLSSLSGCFFPRDMFPQTMKKISLFTPHGWALKAFDAVLSKSTVDLVAVATCCAMLILFAATFFAAGSWRFRAAN